MTGLPWLRDAPLFASGSAALVELVRWAAREQGWRRVWLPSYYCPDVPSALHAAVADTVELLAYADAELWAAADLDSIPARPGDAVVVANQLGVRARPDTDRLEARGAVIVEDHSHDLAADWALTSTADYAFASLRKTLPIPDGGAVWSPRGLHLPPEPMMDDEAGDADRLALAHASRLATAMTARARASAPSDDRLRFRALARIAAEPGGTAAHRGISPVSRALLPQMPMQAWRERRRANLAVLAEAVAAVGGARVLVAPPGGVAFALTLAFDTEAARRAAQVELAARAVAPVVLWRLAPGRDWGVGAADADLSNRILSIHGDQRYDEADMHQLAGILREVLQH